MKLSRLNKEHVARILGREYKIGFREAKRIASRFGATRFEYDGVPWVFVSGKWIRQ